jgi:hypothetical protein
MDASEPPSTTVRAFLSYSHKDEDIRGALVAHLALLSRQGLSCLSGRSPVDPGAGVDSRINVMLETADLIILLVSASFLSSDYCYEKEMRRALARHHLGTVVWFP